MRQYRIEIDIAAPRERVWKVMSDVERWSEWTESITSVKQLAGSGFAVGSRFEVRQPKLPRAEWTVTEIDPGKSFTWVSANPGVRVVGTHTVESTGTGSIARLSLEYGGALGGALGWLSRGVTERYLAFEANGLKERSETHATAHIASS